MTYSPQCYNSQQSCEGNKLTDPASTKCSMFTGVQQEGMLLWTVITMATFTGEIILGIISTSKHDSGFQKTVNCLYAFSTRGMHWICTLIVVHTHRRVYFIWIRNSFFCGHCNPIQSYPQHLPCCFMLFPPHPCALISCLACILKLYANKPPPKHCLTFTLFDILWVGLYHSDETWKNWEAI